MIHHAAPCTGSKTCSKCGESKPVLAFGADPGHADGMRSDCRNCQSEYQIAYAKKRRDRKPRAMFRHPLLET